jgi:pentatricopeptide repeat protein
MQAVKEGFELGLLFGNSFVDMYAKCGLLDDARNVLNMLEEEGKREEVSWTSLIAGYADAGRCEEALDCFGAMTMPGEGIAPNASTFTNLLKACRASSSSSSSSSSSPSSSSSSCSGAIDRGRELHSRATMAGFGRDMFVEAMLVDMYAVHGRLDDAQHVFDKVRVKNVVVWTALIAGYSKHGFDESALLHLELMRASGISGDAAAYVCAVKACGNLGAVGIGRDLHMSLVKAGILESPPATTEEEEERNPERGSAAILCNALVDMYSRCGEVGEARDAFALAGDGRAWNALVSGLASQGRHGRTLAILREMRRRGIFADSVTYVSVLAACNHAGLVAHGIAHLQEMMTLASGIRPNLEHCNCVVDLLARAGQLRAALAVSASMPFQPDIVTWVTILGACRKWGDDELGRHAFEHAASLHENHLGACVLMSSIHVDACAWEDADH